MDGWVGGYIGDTLNRYWLAGVAVCVIHQPSFFKQFSLNRAFKELCNSKWPGGTNFKYRPSPDTKQIHTNVFSDEAFVFVRKAG